MILAGRAINDSIPRYVATIAVKGLNKVGKTSRGANVLIMGLTYKEDVPDTRESPAENMVEELTDNDVNVYGYDPVLTADEIKHFGAISVPHLDKMMDALCTNRQREVRTIELERVIVQKTRSYFSNERVRTRLIYCKLRGKLTLVRREDTAPTADGGEAA